MLDASAAEAPTFPFAMPRVPSRHDEKLYFPIAEGFPHYFD